MLHTFLPLILGLLLGSGALRALPRLCRSFAEEWRCKGEYERALRDLRRG